MSGWKMKITGQVTVVPCTTLVSPSWTILIMGPTGAGKSTLIEALAGVGHGLGISKDQLAGFTQEVLSYQLINAVCEWSGEEWPVYLIDTPGFSDSKISELEIMKKVKNWMNNQGIPYIQTILYLSPITDTRVPGSKRRTINMLQSLLQSNSSDRVTIVTTMWDQVSNPRANVRAEGHFTQLRDDVWKYLVDKGAHVVRFKNDQTSAMSVVQDTIKAYTTRSPLWDDPISVGDPSSPFLYQELLERINNSRQEIEALRVDHLQLIANPHPLLESVVAPRLEEAKQDLAKFLGQLVTFGRPPTVFKGVPEQVVYQDLLDHVNNAKEDKQALETALARLDMDSHVERGEILSMRIRDAEDDHKMYAQKLLEYTTDPHGYEKASQAILAALPLLPPPRTIPVPVVPASISPEGSVSSRKPLGGRINKGIQSVKDMFTLKSRRGPRR